MYLRLTDGVPEKYSIEQLRRDNPSTSFLSRISRSTLAAHSVYPYTRPDRPAHDPLTANVIDGSFEQDDDGNWSLPWVVEQLPQDQAEANIRQKRDRLLKDTDWIVIKAYERNENIPAEWEVYRQALRDITGQEGFPYNVTWPTKP